MQDKDIHICFATDENYAPYCGVAISSIIRNKAPDDRLHFYILNRKLGTESKQKLAALSETDVCDIQIVDLSPETFQDAPLPDGFYFTVEMYFRILIPQMFTHLDKMLYLDCDILVEGSLADLFAIDMQGNLLGMAKGRGYTGECEGYFNTGVMLIDCKRSREENIYNQLIDFMKVNRDVADRDEYLINMVLHERIYEIGSKWNKQIYLDIEGGDEVTEDDVILHYLSYAKPWHGVYQSALVDEYFEYWMPLSWNIEDNRLRNKNINPQRYYNGRLAFLYLMAKGMLTRESKLTLLVAPESEGELAYAAADLGFKQIHEERLQDIPMCASEHMTIMIESDFNNEIKETLERLGYQNGVRYSFLRTMKTDQIEKALDKVLQFHQDKTGREPETIIYGTANWALKCTEIVTRKGMNLRYYVDSATEKWGTLFCQKKIISPTELKEIANENTLVLIASSAVDEIKQTLLDLGLCGKQIVTFDATKKMEL